jgi:hypothetical protein
MTAALDAPPWLIALAGAPWDVGPLEALVIGLVVDATEFEVPVDGERIDARRSRRCAGPWLRKRSMMRLCSPRIR